MWFWGGEVDVMFLFLPTIAFLNLCQSNMLVLAHGVNPETRYFLGMPRVLFFPYLVLLAITIGLVVLTNRFDDLSYLHFNLNDPIDAHFALLIIHEHVLQNLMAYCLVVAFFAALIEWYWVSYDNTWYWPEYLALRYLVNEGVPQEEFATRLDRLRRIGILRPREKEQG